MNVVRFFFVCRRLAEGPNIVQDPGLRWGKIPVYCLDFKGPVRHGFVQEI